MITAPRLRAFEPDETVQRARWSDVVAVSWPDMRAYLPGVAGSGSGTVSWSGARTAARSPDVVVKWRSSRLRSSAPDFQMAYSRESASAAAEAAMMFVSLPIVDHVRAPSCESMITRVRAAVAATPSRMRTL